MVNWNGIISDQSFKISVQIWREYFSLPEPKNRSIEIQCGDSRMGFLLRCYLVVYINSRTQFLRSCAFVYWNRYVSSLRNEISEQKIKKFENFLNRQDHIENSKETGSA